MRPFVNQEQMLSRSLGGWVGAGLMGSTLMVMAPATAATTLSAWQFDPATRQFTVTLPSGVAPRYRVAAEPARIILEIPQTQMGQVETERGYDGAVRSIRLSEQDGDILQVVLELAPGTILDPNHAQLTSMSAGDQTRWVLTPLVTEVETLAREPSSTADPGNSAELPALPSIDPAIAPPMAGSRPQPESAESAGPVVEVPAIPPTTVESEVPLGPPSAAAALPPATADEHSPATPSPNSAMVVELPVMPAAESRLAFPEEGQGRLSTTAANLMLPSDVDSLENLPDTLPIDPFSIDLAETEQVTVPGLDELDAAVGPVAAIPPTPGSEPEAQSETSDEAEIATNLPAAEVPETAPTQQIEIPQTDRDIATNAPIDTASVSPIVVAPPGSEIAAEAETWPENDTTAIASDQDMASEAGWPIAVVPPLETVEAPNQAETATAITEPLPPPQATDSSGMTQAPADINPLSEEAPAADTPAQEIAPSQDLLAVPELPTTASSETVIPPNTSYTPGEVIVAASEPINFGQPLPGNAVAVVSQPFDGETTTPENQPTVPPDVLIAAGTVLQLRYPGTEPLVLEPGTDLQEVLVLENEIRDPITQGVLAPRGSQLIGQFEPNGTNQHWVSEMLIVPAGQRVPLASTSEYLVGTPQVNTGRMAAGMGAGALALALLTSFSGIGLIGGATTMVGTAPQQVVIEPNQIIAVQVTDNVPRSMPIAAGPDLSREWGVE